MSSTTINMWILEDKKTEEQEASYLTNEESTILVHAGKKKMML